MAVKLAKGLVSFGDVGHHDEAEASGLAGVGVHHDLALENLAKGLEQILELGLVDVSRDAGDEEVSSLVLGVNVVIVVQGLLGPSVHVSVVSVEVSSVVSSVEVVPVISSVQIISSVEVVAVVSVFVVSIVSSVEVISVSHVVVSVVKLSVVVGVLGGGTGLIVVSTRRHASSLVGLFRGSRTVCVSMCLYRVVLIAGTLWWAYMQIEQDTGACTVAKTTRWMIMKAGNQLATVTAPISVIRSSLCCSHSVCSRS